MRATAIDGKAITATVPGRVTVELAVAMQNAVLATRPQMAHYIEAFAVKTTGE